MGQQLFPSDNPWNQKITDAPVAATSAAVMNNITSLYGNGHAHPDFGQDSYTSSPLYGIPFNVVHGNTQPKVHVAIDAYPGESDLRDAPIPANAVLEGDQHNGPTAGLVNRGDSHLIVYDEENNVAYEFFQASRPTENGDGQWHADQESVWDLNKDSFRPQGWTSADAAGLPILPGIVRPDEGLPASQGGQGVINHAIRFTLQNNLILNQFIYPAEHIANSGTNAAVQPPMGTRFRLKAGVDISGLNPESKVVAQAMKDYGLILADNGSNFYFTGASSSVDANNNKTLTWDDSDIQDTAHGLKALNYSDFEVVDTTPAVTGLSAATGAAGMAVTVTGYNFSGAAGHLQVLFGGTPAAGVTVVDDTHVTATVPSGSGTVDVQVQSGVSTGPDPQNVNSPVFGYGVSAVTTADRFTYGSPPATQPAATAETPAPAATGVSVSTSVTATFNESIASGLSFVLNGPAGAVGAAVTYADASHTATLSPMSPLAASTTYTATVSGAKDAAGNTMSGPVTWSFTTAAAAGRWQQTTAADFATGSQSGTTVTNASGGEVQLAPAFSDDFNGSALNSASWTTSSWSSTAAKVSVAGGVLSVAGGAVSSTQTVTTTPVEGQIAFAAVPNQRFGLATGLTAAAGNYWAIFTTAGSTGTLYARVNLNGTTRGANLGALPTGYHDYRVQPVSGGFQFFVDGALKSTVSASFPSGTGLRIVVSSNDGTKPTLQADWVRLASYPSSGTFTSSVLDAGRTVAWGTAAWTANLPAGTTLVVETSSSADGSTWSSWAAATNGAAMASPAARYLRYRLRLSTSDSTQTAVFSDITLNYS